MTGLPPERLVRAVLANLDQWIEQVDRIIDSPEVRLEALQLKRSMMQTQQSLIRIMEEDDRAEAAADENRLDR